MTRSGLSMTDWKLQGSLPPITQSEWEAEFERYKTFPEWQQRQNMTLNEFKFIYFWEYGHRQLGRFIGVAFAAPFGYFMYKRMIPRHMYPRMALLFSLGGEICVSNCQIGESWLGDDAGAQGLIGWWMVKSGLEMDPAQRKEIRVSPYRLATHLGMAFTTYTALLWTGLQMHALGSNPAEMPLSQKLQGVKGTPLLDVMRKVQSVKLHGVANVGLVFTTALAGAFVAGNDAGRAYNTFPLMGDSLVPPMKELFEEHVEPKWRNIFESTALVQLNHRVLAITTLASICVFYRRGASLFQL